MAGHAASSNADIVKVPNSIEWLMQSSDYRRAEPSVAAHAAVEKLE